MAVLDTGTEPSCFCMMLDSLTWKIHLLPCTAPSLESNLTASTTNWHPFSAVVFAMKPVFVSVAL